MKKDFHFYYKSEDGQMSTATFNVRPTITHRKLDPLLLIQFTYFSCAEFSDLLLPEKRPLPTG